jgi:hypothetical protein
MELFVEYLTVASTRVVLKKNLNHVALEDKNVINKTFTKDIFLEFC